MSLHQLHSKNKSPFLSHLMSNMRVILIDLPAGDKARLAAK